MKPAPDRRQKTVELVHFGRKTGRSYRTTVWFVTIGGLVWIGSLNDQRSWVRNLEVGGGRGELDFGDGPRSYTFQRQDEASIGGSFQPALKAKYPLMSRLLALRVRGRACAFTALETG
jgi:hypothetical protein